MDGCFFRGGEQEMSKGCLDRFMKAEALSQDGEVKKNSKAEIKLLKEPERSRKSFCGAAGSFAIY